MPQNDGLKTLAKRVSPNDGGCWFCFTQDDGLVFDTEFDTFVHAKCIISALAKDPEHPEATLMLYLAEHLIP